MSYLNNVSQQALLQLMMPNTSATATTGAQKNDRLSTATVGTVASQEDDDNVDALPDWEEDGWVPTMTNGKQKTPNRIRGELQRYIDESSETQTAIINRMRVNGNTFRRFMNSKTYKDQWSAVQNGTYWAAARLLEQERMQKKNKPAASKKRKANDDNNAAGAAGGRGPPKLSKKQLKQQAILEMQHISSIPGVDETIVCDSCQEVIKKVLSTNRNIFGAKM